MMRLVVGAITGILMALYFMYFIYPMLTIEHANFNSFVNASDTTVNQSYVLGSGFYMVIPLIPLIVAGFYIISYALKGGIGGE